MQSTSYAIVNNCNYYTKKYIKYVIYTVNTNNTVIAYVISILIVIYIRIRAIRKIHTDLGKQLWITGVIFITNSLLIAGIVRSKSRIQNPTRNIAIISIVFLLGMINSIRYSGRSKSRKILGPRSIVGSIVIILSIAGYIRTGINIMITYIIMNVCIEEVSKSSLSDIIPTKNSRNIIFYACMIGFAFSIIENIIYQLQRQTGDNRLRIRTTSVVHIVCSALIIYLTLLLQNKTGKVQAITGGLAGGIILHRIYNRSLISGYTIMTIIILISIYPVLSYLLYQSDVIYDKK